LITQKNHAQEGNNFVLDKLLSFKYSSNPSCCTSSKSIDSVSQNLKSKIVEEEHQQKREMIQEDETTRGRTTSTITDKEVVDENLH
jgi:hypothetical protein